MSTTTVTSPEAPASKNAPTSYATCTGQRHFWLRRVHSAFGLVFGGYITVHLLVNSTGWIPKMYQQNVDKIHQLEPMLPIIELAAIFLPLLVHIVYGLYVARQGVSYETTVKYKYGGNYRYLLQRVTAVILLVFLAYHVGTLHRWGRGDFNAHNMAYQSTVAAIRHPFGDNVALNFAIIVLYLLGVWSAVFHWANGLWTSAIAWGVTTTASAQKRWGHVCLGFGIFMLIVGTLAWAAFAFGDSKLPVEKTRTLPDHAEVALEAHGHDHDHGVKAETGVIPIEKK